MLESRGFGATGAALVTRLSPTDCWGLPEAPSLGCTATVIGGYEDGSADC